MAVIVLLLILFPALLLQDEGGRPLGAAGAFAWLAVCTSSFLWTLLFLSAFLLPAGAKSEGEGDFPEDFRSEGFRKRWRDGMFLLYRYLRTALIPWGQGKRQEIDGLPTETIDVLQRFRAAVIDSHLALALFKGTTFSRATGPGYVRLRSGERPGKAIDLRLQYRRQELEVVTKDGIPLETSISVTFQIRQPQTPKGQQRAPFPYIRGTIFFLTGASSLGPDNEEIKWHERICPLAADILTDEITRHTLDELFGVLNYRDAPLISVSNTVQARLQRAISQLLRCPAALNPVQIRNVSIGNLITIDEVTEQRIESWKDGWEPFKRRHENGGQAEASRYVQTARAYAQEKAISKIARDINGLNGALNEEDWNEVILLRTIAALENMVIDDGAHPESVRKMMSMLNELIKWL